MKNTFVSHFCCPKCSGTNINQYRTPKGPMWCVDCGFRVEEKEKKPNPFEIIVEGPVTREES